MTQSWTYNPDRTLDTHTDFRGNAWQSLWSSCCTSRLVAQTDPLGAATTMAHDAHGNVTRSEKVHDMTVFNQQTTRFDARNRPIAQTVWLVEQTNIDPQNPPIAGGGLAGDPPAHDGQGNTIGLTTRYLYDEDLTDGAGLDGSGTVVQKLGGSGSYTVSLSGLMAKLEADLGTGFFGPGATGVGQVVETTQIDALNHTRKSRADGAGRTLETVDALGNVTTATFDAAGNQFSLRDPNSIGWNATYDARNRAVSPLREVARTGPSG